MKAAFFTQPGDASVFQYGDVSEPQLQANDILIKLEASAVNHLDIWVRQGNPAYKVNLPHITGADGAGIVERVGPEAEGVSVGNRVLIAPGIFCGVCDYCRHGRDNQCDSFNILGAKRHGTYAEKVAVPDLNVVPLPDDISYETAAAFPLSYLTAWHMLEGRAQLKKNETILVVGASSGVAMAAIQIAKLKGATVLATTTSPDKAPKIKETGADDVFIDGEGKEWADWIKTKTKGKGVEIVFEHVGPATWEKSMKSLAKYGRLVTCGATTGPSVPLELRSLFGRDISILGARMGTSREFQDLCAAVFSGKLKPLIDKTFPLSEAAAAHRYMEEKKQVGKILLKP